MINKNIIEDIERRHAQYILSDSDTILYYRTRDFMNYLRSHEIVRHIFDELTNTYQYKESVLKDENGMHKLPYELMASVGNSREEYISFVLHFLGSLFENDNYKGTELFDEAWWICSNDREYTKKERIRLFQQDVIAPIVNYVVDKLRQGLYVSTALEKFAVRAMRYGSLKDVKTEREIQDQIAMFLYDNGRESHREENSGNGNPDFLISDEDGLFVVEVKYIKEDSRIGVTDLKSWTSQLKDYMVKYSSHCGILYIVNRQRIEFAWKDSPHNMSIMNVYIDGKNPSKLRKIKRIEM